MAAFHHIPSSVLESNGNMIRAKKDLGSLRLFVTSLAKEMRKTYDEYKECDETDNLHWGWYTKARQDYITARLCLRSASGDMLRKQERMNGEIAAKEFIKDCLHK